jgi:hypothetical protein
MKNEFRSGSSNNPVYGMGVVGAAVYYIGTAGGFWEGLFGLIKALLWPAFLVFEALGALGA